MSDSMKRSYEDISDKEMEDATSPLDLEETFEKTKSLINSVVDISLSVPSPHKNYMICKLLEDIGHDLGSLNLVFADWEKTEENIRDTSDIVQNLIFFSAMLQSNLRNKKSIEIFQEKLNQLNICTLFSQEEAQNKLNIAMANLHEEFENIKESALFECNFFRI